MQKVVLLSLILFSLTSCEKEKIIIVADHYATCEGAPETKCLLVKEPESDHWTVVENNIEGLTYKPGYTYTLKVKATQNGNNSSGMDAYTFKLVEILNKEYTDTKNKLNTTPEGHWEVFDLKGFTLHKTQKPTFIIDGKKFSGNTGCNRFQGEVDWDKNGAFIPGMLMATKKACMETMEQEHVFNQNLNKVSQYTISHGQLFLTDNSGNTIMKARAVNNQASSSEGNKSTFWDPKKTKLTYTVATRGFKKTISYVAGTLQVIQDFPKKPVKEYKLTDQEQTEIESLIEQMNNIAIDKLKVPSNKNQVDGALAAYFSLSSDKQTVKAPIFDDGNPPVELKAIIEKLVALSNK
jgi:heat shock protein HslJ